MPDLVQVHGAESPARTAAIEDLLGLPVMKAVAVADGADIARARAYVGHATRILFDAKPPKDSADALPGGNGIQFDWRLLADWTDDLPWMLSGGLDSGNVAEAMRISGAPGSIPASGRARPGVRRGEDRRLVAAAKAASAAVGELPIQLAGLGEERTGLHVMIFEARHGQQFGVIAG